MRLFHIYKITSPSGRVYIGQTNNPENRKSQYQKLKTKRQPLIYNSILKHGWDSHTFEIIDTCAEDVVDDLEIYYIEKFNSNKNKYPKGVGLNLSDGGSGVRGKRPYMSIRNKTVKFEGEKNGMFGKKRPDLSERNRLRKLSDEIRGENNHKSKTVINIDNGKIYGSVYLAAADIGINYSTARYYLQNPNKNKTSLRVLQ